MEIVNVRLSYSALTTAPKTIPFIIILSDHELMLFGKHREQFIGSDPLLPTQQALHFRNLSYSESH